MRDQAVSLDEVESAVPQALREGTAFYFLDIQRNQAGDDGCALLTHIASAGGPAGLAVDRLHEAGKHHVDDVIQRLMRHRILVIDNGIAKFQIELVRRWFTGVEDQTF